MVFTLVEENGKKEMESSQRARKGRSSSITIYLVLPFVIIPMLLGFFLLGIAADRKLERQLQEIRKESPKEVELAPTKYDQALSRLINSFKLTDGEETAFYASFERKDATVPKLLPWLNKFSSSFEQMRTYFPPDPNEDIDDLKSFKPLLNEQADPSVIAETARRSMMLIKLQGLLKLPEFIPNLSSYLRFGFIAGRGARGKLRLFGGEMSNTIVFTAYGEIFELLKRGTIPKDECMRLIRLIETYEKLRIPEGILFQAESDRNDDYLAKLQEQSGFWWSLPRLAFIGDPRDQVRTFGEEAKRIIDSQPAVSAIPELRQLFKSYETGFSTAAPTIELLLKENTIKSYVSTYIKLARGRSAAKALLVMAILFRYKARSGGFPPSLNSLQEEGLTVPKDPLNGKDYVYRPRGNVFILYSIGIDNEDNGGDGKKDIVFTSPEGYGKGR